MTTLPEESGAALAGRTVAVTEGRELDLFCGLLERRGATVLRYPLLNILDAPDPAPVLAWCKALAAGGLDDLILLTGEGLRRLLGCIDRHQPELRAPFIATLSALRTITRGPKPARALKELGLAPTLAAREPTTAGVIATLAPLALQGRRIGVQLYGTEPNLPLIDFLETKGALPSPVAPYVYAHRADDPLVLELLQKMRDGAVNALALTSKAQVQRLFEVAPADQVRASLQRCAIAAVGPVVAAELRAHGIDPQAMPAESWFLKPLTAELSRLLSSKDVAAT